MSIRHVANNELERRQVVRRLDGVGVLEVDLVLAVRYFVVAGLDLEPVKLRQTANSTVCEVLLFLNV